MNSTTVPQTGFDELAASGKSVFLYFTADWSVACQLNLKYAINTEEFSKAIKANNVTPMLADWTDYSAEMKTALNKLTASDSLPVLAIFPAGHPHEPIILRDLLSKSRSSKRFGR